MKFQCHQCLCLTDSFYKSCIDKKDYICKSCSKIKNKEYRDKIRSTNNLEAKFCYARASAKNRGKEFTFTKEQYVESASQPCHYCKRPSHGLGIGLDRIDNGLGYTPENTLPCCRDCNRIRGNALTVKEMEIAMIAVLAFRNQA